jgi:hypothetical protein
VALVQPPATFDGHPHAIGGIEDYPKRTDCTLQNRGKGDIRLEFLGLQLTRRLNGLSVSLIAQVDIMPTREQILDVPGTLAVTHQD